MRLGPFLTTMAVMAFVFSTSVPSPSYGSGLSLNCDYWRVVCFERQLASPHFVVWYNTTGPFAVSDGWARNVSTTAEKAYSKLVLEDGFPQPARIPIPVYLDLRVGGFTSFLFCDLCTNETAKASDLNLLQIEYRVQSPCKPDCGLPTGYFGISHELFHTIQYTMAGGTIHYGHWLSEGSANWAGYEVSGDESRWDPWQVSVWLGPNGTTDVRFERRSYDTAFFFAFLTEFYGGQAIMHGILSNANDTTDAGQLITSQLHAAGYDKTMLDVTSEFAAAIVAGNFTDRNGAAYVLNTPPPTAVDAVWTGANVTLATFTNDVNLFHRGDRLQVAWPFGIEYVKIQPASNRTLELAVKADDPSCLRTSVITHSAGEFETHPLVPGENFTLTSPLSYDEVYLAFTRGECTSPVFVVSMHAGIAIRKETTDSSPVLPQKENLAESLSQYSVPAILGFAGLALLFAYAILRSRKTH